mmetsp:Transcript_40927/g.81391  ORF Transcript_40927/g.81391 Transcript_40927/m.81391 type:complete len:282 (+) Transcript_40927:95-940(+)
MSGAFELVSMDKFLKRGYSLLTVCPELFFCGFLWAGFSYACKDCSSDSASFYFATGFGSGMGAILGHCLSHIEFIDGFPTISRQEIFHACAFFCAIFFGSGTTWQRIVNDTIDYGMDFTQAFFFVYLMCFLLFLTVLTIMRFLNTQYTKNQISEVLHVDDDFMSVQQRFYFDVQLALSIASADAFFVGTVTGSLDNNWLAPAFGVYGSTHELAAMCKSGAATLVGFVVFQLVENAFMRDCWLDPVEPEKVVEDSSRKSNTGVTLNNSAQSPLQSQPPGDSV